MAGDDFADLVGRLNMKFVYLWFSPNLKVLKVFLVWIDLLFFLPEGSLSIVLGFIP